MRPIPSLAAAAVVCCWACTNQSGSDADTQAGTLSVEDAALDLAVQPDDAAAATDGVASEVLAADASPVAADSAAPPECMLDADCPATLTPCAANRCTSAAKCITVLLEGAWCDDGDPCTVSSACSSGKCASSGASWCQCQTSADCAAAEDGDLCNGTLLCNKAVFPYSCKVILGSPVTCPTPLSPCQIATCDASSGQCGSKSLADGTACQSDDPCALKATCTAGTCSPSGPSLCQCTNTADCGKFEDGNLCNGTLYCDASVFPKACKVNPATVVGCATAADTACQKTVCNSKTGQCAAIAVEGTKQICDLGAGLCQWIALLPGEVTPAAAACDDGKPCTSGDHCAAGSCVSGTDVCACKSNADCAAQDDGNLCNGTAFCNLALKPPACVVNPATVATCQSVNDTACAKNACEPKTGACACAPGSKTCTLVPIEFTKQVCADSACHFEITAAGAGGKAPACDDGNPCTTGDACQNGTCAPGTDTCLCKTDADCAKEDDGNLCNGTLFCNKATLKCQVNPATVVTCPSYADTGCTKSQCEPKSGLCALASVADGSLCEDGNACTKNDSCTSGLCTAGVSTCVCATDTDCIKYHDGDFCKGTLICNKGANPPACQLNVATKVVCQSVNDTACQKNTCIAATGKCIFKAAADDSECEDGSTCTTGDSCQVGKCQGGANLCECEKNTDCAAKDDDDLCNGSWYCDKSGTKPQCKPNPVSAVVCPKVSTEVCLVDTCDPKSGKCLPTAKANGSVCDDNNPCTKSDACQAGSCSGGTSVCECQNNDDCLKKDDGNLCNGVPYCDKADASAPVCKANPASVVYCPKTTSEACLSDLCDPKTGKCSVQPKAAGTPCDDGSVCTLADECSQSTCSGSALDCDDANPCTVDGCDKAKGCSHAAKACDDGNTCSADLCDKKTGGCTFDDKILDFKGCDADQDGCTVNDSCFGGACKTGFLAICKVGELDPCQKAVCISTGPKAFQCAAQPKVDGELCDAGGGCLLGSQCKSGVCQAGTVDKLYAKAVAVSGANVTLRGAAKVSGGTAVVGQWQAAGEGRLLVWKLGEDGAPLWPKPLLLPSPLTDSEATATDVAPLGDGSLVVLGQIQTAGEGRQVRLVQVDKAGTSLLWDHAHGDAKADERPQKLTAHPAGGYVLAGSRDAAGAVDGMVLRLSASGLLVWQWHGGGGANDSLYGSRVHSDGSLTACGWSESATIDVRRFWLQRLDAGGNPGPALHPLKETSECRGIAPMLDGGYVAVGLRKSGPQPQIVWVRGNAAGSVVAGPRTLPGYGEAWDVAVQPSGVAVVVGRSLAGSLSNAWLAGLADDGHVAWQTEADVGGIAGLLSRTVVDDTGAIFAVGGIGNPATKGLLVRADPWGHLSCAQGGQCATKKVTLCADPNPCTDDLCDPAQGCVAIAHQEPCSDGDACSDPDQCKQAVCLSGPAKNCDDANLCTLDSCDKAKGCVHDPQDKANCADDSVCTSNEVCAVDVCKATVKDCSDGDPCTQDSCNAKTGCINAAVPDETVCGEGKVCAEGKCVARWAKFITAGAQRTGAIRPDGSAWCWGNCYPYSYWAAKQPIAVDGLVGVTHLDAGVGYMCATGADKLVRCWGTGQYGTLGNLTCGVTTNLSPQVVPGVSDAVAVDASGAVSMAVTSDGKLWQWGLNDKGSFGTGVCAPGATACIGQAALNPTVAGAVKVSLGWSMPQPPLHFSAFTLVLTGSGDVLAAGGSFDKSKGCDGEWENYDSFVGDSAGSKGTTTFLKVALSVAAIDIAQGSSHRCALDKTGQVWCWGKGADGQIGNGGKQTQAKPVAVFAQPANAIGITAGNGFTCAVDVDAKVWCWGVNGAGQLGSGTGADSTTPVFAKGLSGVKQVVAGWDHACARRTDGSVWCWGYDEGDSQPGTLGVGKVLGNKLQPVPAPVIGTLP